MVSLINMCIYGGLECEPDDNIPAWEVIFGQIKESNLEYDCDVTISLGCYSTLLPRS